MKNHRRTPQAVAWVALVALALGCASAPAQAPEGASAPAPAPAEVAPVAATPDDPLVGRDPRITVGQLPSGLRYFVLPHPKPEKRAYFWLAVNAGSVLEDDDQQGLAHFLEHMGFNGTRRFPKQDIVNFVEKAGMKFGPHLNAYTSFDETVYQLQVPTDDPALVDTTLQVLYDWAQGMTLDPGEIDKERGVVVEEWRRGLGAQRRLWDKVAPVVFHGSAYARRLPIGKPEIIKSAPPKVVERFYKDWYRPDMMAVIAVGDFKAAEIEAKIQKEFAGLTKPASARPRPAVLVPKHEETLIAIETDPEATMSIVTVMNKMPHRRESTVGDFRRTLADQLFHTMLNGRLDELRRKPDAPFLGAFSTTESMVRSADVFEMQAAAKEGQVDRAVASLMEELLRVERHGFTKTELERAKKLILRQVQQAVIERDKRDGRALAAELVRHFLENEGMPGPEGERDIAVKFLPTFTVEELGQLAKVWVGNASRVVTVTGPAKAKMPSKEAIAAVVAAAEKSEVTAYDDAVSNAPLLAEAPKPGKVVATKTIAEIGVTEWKLSSGARVIVKPTTFKNDEVALWGFSPGGHSLVKDADFVHARFAGAVVGQGGLGPFDAVGLRKALAGKIASADGFLGELEEGVRAGSSPEDLRTMFELLYLTFTSPRRDETAFASWRTREIERARNRRLSPEGSFQEDLGLFLSQNHPRRQPVTPELIEKVNLDRAFAIYRERFADTGDFTFVIVGNVELASLQPLVETYLGGLPSKGRKEKWRDIGVRWPKPPQTKVFTRGQEPKSHVVLLFHGPVKYTEEANDDLDLLGDVLSIRLREVLREELGGVYGVGAGGGIARRPRQEYTFTVSFGCAPENVETLRGKVMEEIAAISKEGISASYLDKVKQARRRQHEVNLKENGFWGSELADAYRYGEDPRKIPEIDKWVERVSSDLVKAAAKRYLKPELALAGILQPENGAKKDTPKPEAAAPRPAAPPALKPAAAAAAP